MSTTRELLQRAKADSDRGTPLMVSVRDLIGYWDAQGRGRRVVASVRSALRSQGLTTEPDFRTVALDHVVRVVAAPVEPAPADEVSADSDAADAADYRLTVGALRSALGGLSSVDPQAPLHAAYTQMLVN